MSRGSQLVLRVCDALTMLESLPPKSVDAVLTDPPYSSGGAMRSDRNASPALKYVGDRIRTLPDFEGDNAGERAQERRIAWWADRAHRVVRPGGYVGFWCDWRTLPLAIDGLQMGGIVFRGVAPWVKPGARPMRGGMGAAAEYLVWGTRGAIDEAHQRCTPGYFASKSVRGIDRDHPTQKPVDVIRWTMQLVPRGGVIVDPFLGSGTSAVAAALDGYDLIGCDVDAHWIGIARERLRAEASTAWQEVEAIEPRTEPLADDEIVQGALL